jgi:hypothetical protein
MSLDNARAVRTAAVAVMILALPLPMARDSGRDAVHLYPDAVSMFGSLAVLTLAEYFIHNTKLSLLLHLLTLGLALFTGFAVLFVVTYKVQPLFGGVLELFAVAVFSLASAKSVALAARRLTRGCS